MGKIFNSDNFIAGLDEFAQAIANSIPNSLQVVANDGVALIQERLQEKGLNSDEQELPAYTLGYKKYKEKVGKYTGKTNLTLSGSMLHDLKVTSTGLDGNQYRVTVGFVSELNNKKASGNSEHYGDILKVSKNEEAI